MDGFLTIVLEREEKRRGNNKLLKNKGTLLELANDYSYATITNLNRVGHGVRVLGFL